MITAKAGGCYPTKGKLYSEWMENVQFLKMYRILDIPTFDGTILALQYLLHFSMRIGGLLENNAQRIMIFASTLVGNAFKWFEGLFEGSI